VRDGDPAAPWLGSGPDYVTIQVIARTGSSRRAILRTEARGLLVALVSPPEKGRANTELLNFMAELAGVSRSSVTLLRGAAARFKTVYIATHHPLRTAALFRAYS
jgi:uncharacterized protein YggU (UPF0235/DUF167 family)